MQTNQTQQTPAYLRLADMRIRYRVSGSTIWKWAADPNSTFPKPIKLGANTTVWRLADLLKWEDEQARKGV
jgi:prophage regulatory protein